MKRSNPNDNPWRMAGIMGALGMDMVVCLLLGYFAGSWLSERTGQRGWLIGGVLGGLVIGLLSIVLLIRRYLEEGKE